MWGKYPWEMFKFNSCKWLLLPVIFADPFLPRVVELATTSSDRQTKVSTVDCTFLMSYICPSCSCPLVTLHQAYYEFIQLWRNQLIAQVIHIIQNYILVNLFYWRHAWNEETDYIQKLTDGERRFDITAFFRVTKTWPFLLPWGRQKCQSVSRLFWLHIAPNNFIYQRLL